MFCTFHTVFPRWLGIALALPQGREEDRWVVQVVAISPSTRAVPRTRILDTAFRQTTLIAS